MARLARVGTESLDAQVGEAETLDLGNIHCGVAVDEVGGRAMCLIAGDGPVGVRPGRPLLREVLKQQVAECLTVVAQDLCVPLLEHGQIVFEPIASALFKLFEQGGCPCGGLHLVRVVEERVRVGGVGAFESLLDVPEVVAHGLFVEMVDDPALATRGSALHLHHAIAHEEGHHVPAGVLQFLQPELQGFLVCLVGRALDLCFQHVLRAPCQHPVTDEVRHIVGLALMVGHHLLQTTVWLVLLGNFQCQTRDLPAVEDGIHEHHLAGTLLQGHPRASEGPACTCSHIHLDAGLLTDSLYLAQHLHPLIRKIGDVVRLIALHPIDGRDLDGSDAVVGILLHGPLQVVLIHGGTQPPPACAGLCLLRGCGPRLGGY